MKITVLYAADVGARWSLRSSSSTAVVVPVTRRSTIGDRAFPVAAASAWNSLPSFVTSSSSLSTFKRHLKTYLFATSYTDGAADPFVSFSVSVDLHPISHPHRTSSTASTLPTVVIWCLWPPDPNRPDQPNPWMDPKHVGLHVHLWVRVTLQYHMVLSSQTYFIPWHL